jgi:hypothetical protein
MSRVATPCGQSVETQREECRALQGPEDGGPQAAGKLTEAGPPGAGYEFVHMDDQPVLDPTRRPSNGTQQGEPAAESVDGGTQRFERLERFVDGA